LIATSLNFQSGAANIGDLEVTRIPFFDYSQRQTIFDHPIRKISSFFATLKHSHNGSLVPR